MPATNERPTRRTRPNRGRQTQARASSAASSRTWDIVGFVSAAIFIGIVVFTLKPMHNQSASNDTPLVASAAPAKAQ